jgi:hypothetical protein
MIADFVTLNWRRERAAKGKERVTRGQPSDMPIIPLRLVARNIMPGTATSTTDGSNATEVSDSVLVFDPDNAASVQAVTHIVQAVLKEMGIEKISLPGKHRTKDSSSGQSRGLATMVRAIRAQQALMDPLQDCA